MTNNIPGGVLTKSNDIPPLLGPAYSPVPSSSDIFHFFAAIIFVLLKYIKVCSLLLQCYKSEQYYFVSEFPMNSSSFHEML